MEETAEKSKEKWLLNGGLCYHLYQGGDSESMKTIIALASAALWEVLQVLSLWCKKNILFFNIVFNWGSSESWLEQLAQLFGLMFFAASLDLFLAKMQCLGTFLSNHSVANEKIHEWPLVKVMLLLRAQLGSRGQLTILRWLGRNWKQSVGFFCLPGFFWLVFLCQFLLRSYSVVSEGIWALHMGSYSGVCNFLIFLGVYAECDKQNQLPHKFSYTIFFYFSNNFCRYCCIPYCVTFLCDIFSPHSASTNVKVSITCSMFGPSQGHGRTNCAASPSNFCDESKKSRKTMRRQWFLCRKKKEGAKRENVSFN